MSKNFRREQFGNSGFAKFPDYTKTLPPPSGKNEENKKPINIFFALVLFMLISNIVYTLGIGQPGVMGYFSVRYGVSVYENLG